LAGINNIEKANEFLSTFWDDYNARFSIFPEDSHDAHRPLLKSQNLEKILCAKEYGTVEIWNHF
jgi:hypothetical protein